MMNCHHRQKLQIARIRVAFYFFFEKKFKFYISENLDFQFKDTIRKLSAMNL